MYDVYDGTYHISSHGRVKRILLNFGRLLKITKYTNGYEKITICGKNYSIHRLVAIHFISNPNKLPLVNHIDLDKTNNNVNNLEWVTLSGNMQHAIKHGHCRKNYVSGENNKVNKPVIQYSLSGKFIREWFSVREAAKQVRVSEETVGSVIRKRKGIAGGFQWRFKTDNKKHLTIYVSSRGKRNDLKKMTHE